MSRVKAKDSQKEQSAEVQESKKRKLEQLVGRSLQKSYWQTEIVLEELSYVSKSLVKDIFKNLRGYPFSNTDWMSESSSRN